MLQGKRRRAVQRTRRRWSFADCLFDEANWTLTVGNQRVRIESKPLAILRELLLHVGDVVSKGELLDSIWGEVTVVEASLPTAIRKLRVALGDGGEGRHFIETVPAIGYRFVAPVELFQPGEDAEAMSKSGSRRRFQAELAVIGAAVLLAVVLALLKAQPPSRPIVHSPQTFTEAEVKSKLRDLDVRAVERMIAAGWNAKTLFGKEQNDSLTYVLEICEWNPGHDRHKMLLMARTLLEAGVRVDRRNVWGDTAYSIAKAPRYCGNDHPVTQMIRRACAEGPTPLRDHCMASYELARGRHFTMPPQYTG
ncbi:MAG: transcriptional regulator [Sphingomicrobium sp.]